MRTLVGGLSAIFVLGVQSALPLRAQAPSVDHTNESFDVASVKRNTSGDWRKSIGPAPGGRFLATNQTLRELMPFAFGLPQMTANIRIVGGPKWIDSDRFDVVAKTNGMPSPQELSAMLRTMLNDRFKLAAHTETLELPIYMLVMAKSAGTYGPRLRRSDVSEVDCAEKS